MNPRRRILLANICLDSRTGTETHLRDHALAFLQLGHSVMVYAPELGPLAREISAAGGEVKKRLDEFSIAPDIVHGNHHLPLMQALLHFRGVPAVLCCHDATHPNARPVAFPRILRHAAVDLNCRERVMKEIGLPASAVTVIPNSVDLTRFLPRPPLPPRAGTALVLSHYAHEKNFLPILRAACRRSGLQLDVAGAAAGRSDPHPERLLARHDIVFGKARCALEALATGCHVVLCDFRGLGPGITADNFDELRQWNFGARVLTRTITESAVLQAIGRYDPATSSLLRDRVRAECGVEHSARSWLALYEETIQAFQTGHQPDPETELAAASDYQAAISRELAVWQRQHTPATTATKTRRRPLAPP